nr:GlsB/YeaQ/YmgE family stress response membrane protein [Streptomyces tailanensis]
MEISGIISAILIGIVIGVLGRLVVPGRQRIGVLWTILVGVAAALVGTGIAAAVGVAETKGVDWMELAIGLAALGVARTGPLQGPPLTPRLACLRTG